MPTGGNPFGTFQQGSAWGLEGAPLVIPKHRGEAEIQRYQRQLWKPKDISYMVFISVEMHLSRSIDIRDPLNQGPEAYLS